MAGMIIVGYAKSLKGEKNSRNERPADVRGRKLTARLWLLDAGVIWVSRSKSVSGEKKK